MKTKTLIHNFVPIHPERVVWLLDADKLYKNTVDQGAKNILEEQKAHGTVTAFDIEGALDKEVRKIEDSRALHDKQMLRVRRDMEAEWKRLQKTITTEEEDGILKDWGKDIIKVGDKYIPQGFESDFEVHVYPKKSWDKKDFHEVHPTRSVGELLSREKAKSEVNPTTKWGKLFIFRKGWAISDKWTQFFGETVDAKSFDELVKKNAVDEQELLASRASLALLKHTKKVDHSLMDLVRGKGFLKGIAALIAADLDKDIAVSESSRKIAEVSDKIAELIRTTKQQRAMIKAVTEKSSKGAEENEKLFTTTILPLFQTKIDVVKRARSSITPAEFATRKDELQRDVTEAIKRLSHAKYKFSDFRKAFEALFEPSTEEKKREKEYNELKEKVLVQQFLTEKIGAEAGAENIVKEVVEKLKRDYPEGLKLIIDKTIPLEWELWLAFFFTDTPPTGIPVLPRERRMTVSGENIATLIERIQWYEKYNAGTPTLAIMNTFATDWGKLKAEKFDAVFDRIVAGRAPTPEEATPPAPVTPPATPAPTPAPATPTGPDLIAAREKEKLAAVWEKVTGSSLDEAGVNDLFGQLQANTTLKNFYDINIEKLTNYQRLMQVFFTGHFGDGADTHWIPNTDILVTSPIPATFLLVLENIKNIAKLGLNVANMKKLLETYMAEYPSDSLIYLDEIKIPNLYRTHINPPPEPTLDAAARRLKEDKATLVAVWEKVTSNPLDEADVDNAYNQLQSDPNLQFFKINIAQPTNYQKLMKVFFTGKFDDNADGHWVPNIGILAVSPNITTFLHVLNIVRTISILRLNPDSMKKLLEGYMSEHDGAALTDLNDAEILRLYRTHINVTPPAPTPDVATRLRSQEKATFATMWEKVTGMAPDTVDAEVLLTMIESEGLGTFYRKLLARKPEYQELMSVFFTGHFDAADTGPWTTASDSWIDGTPDNFVQVLKRIKHIAELPLFDRPQWKKMFAYYLQNTPNPRFLNLDEAAIQTIYNTEINTPAAPVTTTPAAPSTPEPAPEDPNTIKLAKVWEKVTGTNRNTVDISQLLGTIQSDPDLPKFYTNRFLQTRPDYQAFMEVFFKGSCSNTEGEREDWINNTSIVADPTIEDFITILQRIQKISLLTKKPDDWRKMLEKYEEQHADSPKKLTDLTNDDIKKLWKDIQPPVPAAATPVAPVASAVTASPATVAAPSVAAAPAAPATPTVGVPPVAIASAPTATPVATPVAPGSAEPAPTATPVVSVPVDGAVTTPVEERSPEQQVLDSMVQLYKLATSREMSEEVAEGILAEIGKDEKLTKFYLDEFYRKSVQTSPYVEIAKIFLTGSASDGIRHLREETPLSVKNFRAMVQIMRNLSIKPGLAQNKDALKNYLANSIQNHGVTDFRPAYYLQNLVNATSI